jgi:uncharacterized protein (TIGR03437 family)
VYSTYLGSSGSDHLNSIDVDRHGAAYVFGHSAVDGFPVTAQALQPNSAGGIDLVLAKLSFNGSRLLYSSYLGGSENERSAPSASEGGGRSLVERGCMAYVTGGSLSSNFPVSAALQASAGGANDSVFAKVDPTADLGEPAIGCGAGALVTQTPVVDVFAPRSMASLYGRNFSSQTVIQPELDGNGLLTTNLGNTCVEVGGIRAAMIHVLPTQINFQVPVNAPAGWVRVFVIRNCGTAEEVRSEPLFVEIAPVQPAFFNFVNNLSGENPIAGINETQTTDPFAPVYVGPADLGPAFLPANTGDILSVYLTGAGATMAPLATGQIPGGLFPVAGEYSLTLGGVEVTEIFYLGAAPDFAGGEQLQFAVPEGVPPGNHQLILTVDGVSTPIGPFIAVR